jgi:hypothetical protein
MLGQNFIILLVNCDIKQCYKINVSNFPILQEEKEKLCLTCDTDGEFYMCLEDFFRYFDDIEICNLTSEGIDGDESGKLSWHETKINGAWVEGQFLEILKSF